MNAQLRIYFIRHGETEWSLSGQYSGRADISLTPHGEDEARKLGQRLHGILFSHVLTSPLRRAQETCALAALGPTPMIEPDLAEWDNGDDEGRTPAEILKSRPEWNLFRDGSPNGETPAQISDRTDRFIARLSTLDGNIALFSHSHFGRVLAARWMGLSVEQAQPFLLSTGSVSVLCYAHERTDQPALALWNSSAHEFFGQEDDERSVLKQRAIDRWENEGGEISHIPIQHHAALGAAHGQRKKLFVFDLDGTLAESKAALEQKQKWDADFTKRKKIQALLKDLIPEFTVRLGGTTSIDVTKLGIDKAYGIKKLREILGIELEEMLFAGDALFAGGNDYPVKEAGVVSIQVNNAEEAKRVIETFLSSCAGIQSATQREEKER